MNLIESREIPVVIVHFGGKQDYLKFALKSAADFNSIVVLVGDETNKNSWKNHYDTTVVESTKYQDFQKNYVHKTYISEQYENLCLKRAFVLEKWMKSSGYKQAFMLDSDVITFANYSKEVYPLLPDNCIASLMTTENQDNFKWASSPNFSYWTLEALESYTNFCIEAYKNKNIRDQLEAKWKWHQDHNQPGGVCEMTLLYLWSKDNPHVANLTSVINDMTVDYNINDADNYFENEYQMQFGIKKFIFKKGIPYGYNNILKKEIKFICIHCQGRAKYLMRYIYSKSLRNLYYLRQLLLETRSKMKL